MRTETPSLPLGYVSVPPGRIATVVTCLEMHAAPAVTPARAADELSLRHMLRPTLEEYRSLHRLVGEHWMWVSRLTMADEELSTILENTLVEVYMLTDAGRPIGLLELDFREEGQCELGYFGLVTDAIGKGAGRFLMNQAIERAWSRPISRFWVHTCHLDSPAALPFYQRSGFKPFRQMVETIDDPRLTGLVPRTASPHVPIIEA